MDISIERQHMLDALHAGVCVVEFVKKDNTIRKMRCTLQRDSVEAVGWTNSTSRTKTPNANQISVIDLEKNEWRSFLVDSVISFNKE